MSETPIPWVPVKPGIFLMALSCWTWIWLTALWSCHQHCISADKAGSDMERSKIVLIKSFVSSWIHVQRHHISMFNLSSSSCAWQSLKYLIVASRHAGWVHGPDQISCLEWHNRSNSLINLYSTISFHKRGGCGGSNWAAWVLYQLNPIIVSLRVRSVKFQHTGPWCAHLFQLKKSHYNKLFKLTKGRWIISENIFLIESLVLWIWSCPVFLNVEFHFNGANKFFGILNFGEGSI